MGSLCKLTRWIAITWYADAAAGADERMEIGGRVSWWIDAVAASVLTSGGCIDATYCSDRQRTLIYMIIFYDSSQIIFDECSVDKFGDKWRIDSICKCFGIVDKWRTKKIVNECLLSLQKHKDILPSIFLQFPYNLLFYTVLKHQIQPFPTLSPGSNSFPPFPWLHPRIWRYSPILPPRQAAK